MQSARTLINRYESFVIEKFRRPVLVIVTAIVPFLVVSCVGERDRSSGFTAQALQSTAEFFFGAACGDFYLNDISSTFSYSSDSVIAGETTGLSVFMAFPDHITNPILTTYQVVITVPAEFTFLGFDALGTGPADSIGAWDFERLRENLENERRARSALEERVGALEALLDTTPQPHGETALPGDAPTRVPARPFGRGIQPEALAELNASQAEALLRKQSRGQIGGAVSISERPAEVEDRAIPGHWEGDLIAGINKSYIATLVERHSRFVMLIKVDDKSSPAVVKALIKQVGHLPQEVRKSLTWDRGLEMARYKNFSVATDVDIYFCDPRSPWQRGTN